MFVVLLQEVFAVVVLGIAEHGMDVVDRTITAAGGVVVVEFDEQCRSMDTIVIRSRAAESG